MQKIATRIFIGASIAFALIGIVMIITAPQSDAIRTGFDLVIFKLFFIDGLIILSSFALSVAGKYLGHK